MRYISTNGRSAPATFREAVLGGQPDDLGLYFPEQIPRLSAEFLRDFKTLSPAEIAFEVVRPFVGGEIDDERLFAICAETVDFPFPLVPVSENIFALELFHGPTLAFKDVGARFMSRCLRHFSAGKDRKTVVLVATSGDTGGAVAQGFAGGEAVEVVVLYPSGKVSEIQERQIAALGGNVTALEIEGDFDACQSLAKRALADSEIKRRVFLTSANSINAARWLPQQFYYFYALRQWDAETPPVVSVPSGNFGNLGAGLLAQARGLPVREFVAACNANDAVPRFFDSGEFQARPTVATISNAMDVGAPSNFARILRLFANDFAALSEKMSAVSVTDERTADAMRRVYQRSGYVLDPHGAVGFVALEDHLQRQPETQGIFLATAHPVKFDSVEKILGANLEAPAAVGELLARPLQSVRMQPVYDDLKAILLDKA